MEETKRLFASLQQQLLLQQYLRRKLLLLLQTRVPQGPLCEERNSQQTKYKRHTRAAPSPGTTSQVRTAHSYATQCTLHTLAELCMSYFACLSRGPRVASIVSSCANCCSRATKRCPCHSAPTCSCRCAPLLRPLGFDLVF